MRRRARRGEKEPRERRTRVLLVGRDGPSRSAIRAAIAGAGYAAELVAASELLPAGAQTDVVLVDARASARDGVELTRRLRSARVDTPVLVLGPSAPVSLRVAALDAGADDYLSTPFALDELFARVRALVRRRGAEPDVLRFADVVLHPGSRRVWRGQKPIDLTRTEFALLEVFLRNPRRVLTRASLVEHVWRDDPSAGWNSLDVYVLYLRRKLEEHGGPRLIHTVRGVGYTLRVG